MARLTARQWAALGTHRVLVIRILVTLLCAGFTLLGLSRLVAPASHPARPSAAAHAESSAAIELAFDTPTTGEITGGATLPHRVNLEPGHFFNARIDKGDLGLLVTAFGPDGRKLGEFISRGFEPLEVRFIAETAGAHRLELHSLETDAASRRYTLIAEEPHVAAEFDRAEAAVLHSFAAAEQLSVQWSEMALREAVNKYTEASTRWEATNTLRAARVLRRIGNVYFALGSYDRALHFFMKALALSRKGADPREEARALNDTGYAYLYLGENRKALSLFTKALARSRRAPRTGRGADELRGEAQTLNNMGEVYYSLGELKKAGDFFGRALALWDEAGDRRGRALAHLNLGYSAADSGDLPRALDHFRLSLSLSAATDERRGEAMARTAIGTVHSFLGEKQTALEYHREARHFFRAVGDQQGEAVALNSIGQAYEDLNEPRTALDYYDLALSLFRDTGNRASEAVAEYYIGRAYDAAGEPAQALAHYGRSISLSRALGKRRMEAYALLGVGAIYGATGEKMKALGLYRRLLALYREIDDRRGQARALHDIGYLYAASGDAAKATDAYGKALELYRAAGDRNGEVSALFNLARSDRDRGDLAGALARVRESISLAESLRTKVTGQQLRASYFASVHQCYELYIDLLMQMHRRRPEGGFAAAAFAASESSRARSLLESLAESGADIARGAAPELLERERTLRRLLSAKAEYQMRLLSSKSTEAEAAEVEKELRGLAAEYQEVEARIREQSPRYDTLTRPQPLRLEDVQAELRDDRTLLLEYALGDERSYLWVVTAGGISSYELPGRAEVESLAREVYGLLSARQPVAGESNADYQARVADADARYWERTSSLSRMLLGAASAQLGASRLLVVADGALQYIPFEALPDPAPSPADGPAAPLVLKHEVVSLPSASTLAAFRREARPTPARKTLAVLADPVFERDDVRIKAAPGVARGLTAERPESAAARSALRAVGEAGISRLSYARREAEALMAVVPPKEGMLVTGFDANRETATGPELGNYRIVHFATHGIIDSEHPNLSGVVLSLFDEQGNGRDGFLALHDVYNLKLSADLVVLSACRTALGREVRGEGLIGLTRGFMYAGSKTVVASLWKVDDRATAELMEHFYSAMLKDGLAPAAALRAAKEAMWRQERWRSPYFWAAFVLQGEYEGPIVSHGASPAAGVKALVLPMLLLALLAAGGCAARRVLARRPGSSQGSGGNSPGGQ